MPHKIGELEASTSKQQCDYGCFHGLVCKITVLAVIRSVFQVVAVFEKNQLVPGMDAFGWKVIH